MMRYAVSVTLTIALTVFASAAQPSEWPQFRGPNGSGIAQDQKPPVELGPEKNVKWKVAVPSGLSSPIVVGDLLVITAFDEDKLYTIAYNRADGSEAWRAEAPAAKIETYFKAQGSPAASTCATDGQRIVSYFGSCGLICYDLAGKELWKHEMPTAMTIAGFGTGNSPIIVDGTVILVREEIKEPKIIALDLATGQSKWEKKRESNSAFSTPTIWDTPDGKQIVVAGFKKMIGYDLASGNEVWHVDGMPSACCTTPVAADGKLFFAGWSPGDPSDKDSPQMPTFDSILAEGDADKDGALSKDESQKTKMKDFFDVQDANKDGKLTKDEWDRLLKFSAESRNSAFALKPGGTGDATNTSVLWKKAKGLPYVPSAIVYRGQYLLVKDGGLVTAYDESTGDELYQKRAVATGGYYASPIAANGNVYFVSLDDGTVTVLEGGAPKPKTVAQNPPLGERVAATPAIADDTIYVRTDGHLYAFAEKN
jgi:outer membrane protein assembly factor BamB